MACPAVVTGSRFLIDVLAHLDCQAQVIGSYGFQTLAQPGSPAAVTLIGLLTLFIAIFAFRMLFVGNMAPRDGVNAVLKVAIILTLAASWPAFRTLAYDTVLKGPAEVAAAIAPSTLPSPGTGFAERLQNVDVGIAALTLVGSGRQTGALVERDGVTGQFSSVAMEDESSYGWSRAIYLAATIGSLAVLRISGGLLLALTPFFAGLLLFDVSKGLFAGWMRGLILVALGSLGMTVLLSVELAILEPWLREALNRRSLGYATPTAPTELLAMTLAFAIGAVGMLALLARVAFQNPWHTIALPISTHSERTTTPAQTFRAGDNTMALPAHSRAQTVSESVASTIRREALAQGGSPARPLPHIQVGDKETGVRTAAAEPLGSRYRRHIVRASSSRRLRDRKA